MTGLLRLAVFLGAWLGVDVALAAVWRLAIWLRGAPGPVRYDPLPVPLVPSPVRYADAELLAVDAVLWSYAEAIGEAT